MKKNKKLLIGIGIVATMLLALKLVPTAEKKINVGIVLPLTGDVSNYGVQMLNGAALWRDLHPNSNIKLVIADGKGVASSSINALNKLVMANDIVACISGFSAPTLAMIPIAAQNKVLLINAGAVNPQIKKGGEFVFSLIPDADVEADYIAKYLIENLKRRSCFIYWQNDDSGKGMLDVFYAAYVNYGGGILGVESLHANSIKDSLAKISSTGAKTVFIPANGDNIAKVIKQAYSMGMTDVLWVGYGGAESPSLQKELCGYSGIKLIFSTYAFDNVMGNNEKSKRFISAYRNRYGEIPAYYSASCYDAMELVDMAVQNKCYNSKDIARYIMTIGSFDGVSGTLTVNKGANYVSSGLSFKKFDGEQFSLIENTDFIED